MGSASSKFKKYLHNGDEFAAMQVFQSSPELRKNLDPNLSYGESHNHNTALHYAAKHGMKHLLRTFLNDLGGNPNKKNGSNETVLHAGCTLGVHKTFSAQERRAACVTLLLQWRGAELNSGDEKEKVDLTAQDNNGNTALHHAAVAGLQRCVELLLAHGAPLFAENNDKLTPCDLAMREDHHNIARLLESRMVFADSSDTINEAQLYGGGAGEEVYSGLRTQDLQEAKDQLLVETSDMLNIPLFTAEALLRDNEWSRESLLEKWMKDPVQCCQLAGVQPPTSAWQHCGGENTRVQLTEMQQESVEDKSKSDQPEDIFCDICLMAVSAWDVPAALSCLHRFCSACWERYLTVRIQEGDAHHILCPASMCHILVPPELIEKLVSPEVARRYLQFDIKAFVETNRSIKWCPMAGCGRAVRLPEIEQMRNQPQVTTSHAVDCGNGHFFCWECLGEAHAPSGCQQWRQWQSKITQVKPEQLQTSCTETEEAANCLWLVTNCKPCPNCKSPIQKNEGCNHMKCSKCKFDFCWVCLESWKKHSSATGGYFRCNRFEAVHKADEKQGILISEALLRNQQTTQLNRFLHYYTRFRNHENSRKLEEGLLAGVRKKMENLASSLKKGEVPVEVKFVEEGVRELLKARRILCGSYVYGYYLEDNGYSRTIFEFMQNELEEVTERLSEMVARPYLRTPRSVIVQTTALARRKRHEFARAVSKGLVPPETPPTLRKLRRRNYRVVAIDTNNDAEQVQAIAESLKDLDANNPWVKDARGRHNNLSAIYDWPDLDSDEEEMNHALAVSLLGQCVRLDCTKPRVRNPRTCVLHNYCSLHCSQIDKLGLHPDSYQVNVTANYNMDLVIALEMSRLQMIEDEMKQRQQNQEHKETETSPPGPSSETTTEGNRGGGGEGRGGDEQLNLAIQLSLQQGNDQPTTEYQKTNADITVDYFLKSLAGRDINVQSLNATEGCEVISPPQDTIWATKTSDKEILTGWKTPYVAEDGHFEIGDIHEKGLYNDPDEFHSEMDARFLKRSHSTGDLVMRRGRLSTRTEEPRYHLDSDHSSQHEERPEEMARRILAMPASTSSNRHSLLVQTSGGSTAYCQSSLEDTSDSLNADLEVCGILGANEDSSRGATLPRNLATIGKKCALDLGDSMAVPDPPSEESEQLCDSEVQECLDKLAEEFPPTASPPPIFQNVPVVNINGQTKNLANMKMSDDDKKLEIEKTLQPRNMNPPMDMHRKTLRSGGKTPLSNLRIRICNKSPPKENEKEKRSLETDSSNEYESETGLPKSPTLFISGVSISRTPEPKSPALAGRQSRSSSLTASLPPPPLSPLMPSPLSSSVAQLKGSLNSLNTLGFSFLRRKSQETTSNTKAEFNFMNGSPHKQKENPKSKSASEPEREREMFRFPKSSTDGALSSVLHVQESNLSSDDFHEALFLLERSPKSNQGSKKRKRSKKERQKDKENASSASIVVPEASSAL